MATKAGGVKVEYEMGAGDVVSHVGGWSYRPSAASVKFTANASPTYQSDLAAAMRAEADKIDPPKPSSIEIAVTLNSEQFKTQLREAIQNAMQFAVAK